MIFVTVGDQLAFPRLLEAMDTIAPKLGEPIVAQCGPVKGVWGNIAAVQSMTPDVFQRNIDRARVVVSHAGIGAILSAKLAGKPLVIMPRQFRFGEHRDDHQVTTARYATALPGVHVVWDMDELASRLAISDLQPTSVEPAPGNAGLIRRIQSFVDD